MRKQTNKILTISAFDEVDIFGKTIKIARVEAEEFKQIIKNNPSLIKSIKVGAIVTPVTVKIQDGIEKKGYRLNSKFNTSCKTKTYCKRKISYIDYNPQITLRNPRVIKSEDVVNLSLDQAKQQHIQFSCGDIIWPGIKTEEKL